MTEEAGRTRTEGDDWVTKVTGGIESFVAVIRDHSLRPALTFLRFLVLGLVCLGIALLAAVLGVVGVVRLLTVDAFGGRVWASDLLIGVLLSGSGAFLLRLSGRVGREDVSA